MKKMIEREGLIVESMNAIVKMYADDIRMSFDMDGDKEYWIGEKGTTTLKCLIWYNCSQGEGEGYFTDYGWNVKELRNSGLFMDACLNDADVNHAINEENGKCYLDSDSVKDLIDWKLGVTDKFPISPCGMQNFVDSIIY